VPWRQAENPVEAVHIKRLLHRLQREGFVVLEDSVAPFDFHAAVRSLIRNQEFDDTHLDVCPLPNEALPVTRLLVARIPKQNHCVNGFSLLKERFVKAYA
jgi:hypothetical protein